MNAFTITADQAKDATREFEEGVHVDVGFYLYKAEQLIYSLAKTGEKAILYKDLIDAVLGCDPLSNKSQAKIDSDLRQALVKNGFKVKEGFLSGKPVDADYVGWS